MSEASCPCVPSGGDGAGAGASIARGANLAHLRRRPERTTRRGGRRLLAPLVPSAVQRRAASGADSLARDAGFTLIELLVSLALMGMAAGLLLQGLATAGIVARRERTQASALDEVIAAQRVLRASIERLRPVTRSDTSIPIVDLRGTDGVLTFVGPPLDRAAPDSLQRFRLTRTASGDLVLYGASTRRLGIGREGLDLVGWQPNTMLHGVRALSMQYYGPPRVGERSRWLERWWDRSSPPELVRIRLTFAAGDRRVWPDLVIRPRATSYGACLVDFATGKCVEER